MSWASIMATLWSMVVEWSVLSAEFPTNVPRAKTAAHLTCDNRNTTLSSTRFWCGLSLWSVFYLSSVFFNQKSVFLPFTLKPKYNNWKMLGCLWDQRLKVFVVILVQFSLNLSLWNVQDIISAVHPSELLFVIITHYFLFPLHWIFNPNLPLHRKNFPCGTGFTNWSKFHHKNEYLGVYWEKTFFWRHQDASPRQCFILTTDSYSTQMLLWLCLICSNYNDHLKHFGWTYCNFLCITCKKRKS